jgi:hypothetical protein
VGAQLHRMVDMIGRIQRTILRGVPVSSAAVEEGQQRQRCWRGLAGGGGALKVGMMEGGGGNAEAAPAAGAEAGGMQVALDVGAPFMHAFIIPNYKARAPWPLSPHHTLCAVTVKRH